MFKSLKAWTLAVLVASCTPAYANQVPTSNAGIDQTVTIGSSVTLDGSGSFDPDAGSLVVTAVTQGTNGLVVIEPDNTVTYTPNTGFVGTDTFSYTISDGIASTVGNVTVTVTAVNSSPIVLNDTAVTSVDMPVVIDVLANDSDPDGDPLGPVTVQANSLINGTAVVNADNTVTFTPNPGFVGTGSFTYWTTDGTDWVSGSVIVDVQAAPANLAPVTVDDAANTPRDTPVNVGVLLNDSDPDWAGLSYSWSVTNAPAGSMAVLSNANAVAPTFTPDIVGSYELQLVVNDGLLNSAPDTVFITVTSTSGSNSSLGTLAGGMSPGQFSFLNTTNVNATFGASGASGYILGYTDDMVWNPISKELHFIGGDHQDDPQWAVYDEASNTWRRDFAPWLPTNVTTGAMHGYDHSALDPATGDLYHRPFNTENVQRYSGGSWASIGAPSRSYANCCDALEWFPGLGLIWTGGGGEVWSWNGSWTQLASGLSLDGTWNFAAYNPVHNVLVFGAPPRGTLYKMDAAGVVTQMATPPLSLYDGSGYVGVFTVDPVSGDFLALTPSNRQLHTYDVTTDTWALAANQPPPWSNNSMVATPIAEHGVVAFVNCTGPSSCEVWLYKHAVTQTGFNLLCSDPNTLYCQDFNSLPTYGTDQALNEGIFVNGFATTCPAPCPMSIDNGALKFTIPSQSGAGTSGQYFINFAATSGDNIMPGETVFARWKQKFSADFLNTFYSGGGGWKQGMLGDPTESSCASNEVVLQNTWQRGMPQMYHACGLYEPFEIGWNSPYSTSDIDIQPPSGCSYELVVNQGTTSPGCFMYFPDEWMTFQIGIDYAVSGNDNVRLWVKREADTAWTLVIDYTRNLVDTANGYGKLWLMPYNTGKDSSQIHPEGYTWYDELVISRSFINE